MIADHNSMILWQSGRRAPIAARLAIAGDFLPAGELTIPVNSDWRHLAAGVAPYFDDVDASFMNLECALDTNGLPARPLAGIGAIVSASAEVLNYLDTLRAHAISIANNHSYDFGPLGVDLTRHAISARGMVPLGAGHSLNEAPEVSVWQGPGEVRIGFWAAAKASSDLATRKANGVEPATLDRAERALAAMKSRGARICVALLHVGTIRTNRPDPEDVRLLDSIAKCGFQLVAASHSHRISGYRSVAARAELPTFCFYGLGSLVSGYIASALEREGLLVVAGFDFRGDLARIEVRPIFLGAGGFGEAPSAEMGGTILERFRRLSAEIADGSSERLFYRDVSQHLFRFYARDARTAFRQTGLRGLARKASRVRMRHVRRFVRKVIG